MKSLDVDLPKSDFVDKLIFNRFDRYPKEKELLTKYGKLDDIHEPNSNKFYQSIDHQVMVSEVAYQLGLLAGLPEGELDEIVRHGFVHDWDKRMVRDPDSFTDDEIKNAFEYYKTLNLDETLRKATKHEFCQIFVEGKSTFAQEILFFADNMVTGSRIVSYQDHTREGVGRKPQDDVLYFAEVQVLSKIADKLLEKFGDKVESLDQLPNYVESQIRMRNEIN